MKTDFTKLSTKFWIKQRTLCLTHREISLYFLLVNEFIKSESESFSFPKERMASIIGVHIKDLNKSLKILTENELVSTISYNGKIIYEITR